MDDEVGIPLMNAAGGGGGFGDDAFDDDLDNALAAPDELPQIAGVIDERPPEMREVEYSNSDRWARVGGDPGKNAAVSEFLPYIYIYIFFFSFSHFGFLDCSEPVLKNQECTDDVSTCTTFKPPTL